MTLDFKIEGMHCDACVRRVTAAISNVKGVRTKEVQIGAAKIEFDSGATTPAEIAKALDDIGFRAKAGDAR